MADFKNLIEKERDRLTGLRDEALARRETINQEIATIDTELKAITAYETARVGKKATKKAGATRSGSRTDAIIELLNATPDGLARADILTRLGLKGNKTGEQSISNALNNMRKAGKIARTKDGLYTTA